MVFATYRSEILNVSSSNQRWNNLFEVAMESALALKERGEKGIKVNVQVGGELNLQQVYKDAYRTFIQAAVNCAKTSKPVDECSEREKFSICVACNVPVEMIDGRRLPNGEAPLMSTLRTKVPCAIVWEDGQYVVYYRKPELT